MGAEVSKKWFESQNDLEIESWTKFVAWSAARSGLETPLQYLKSFRIMILIANSEVG